MFKRNPTLYIFTLYSQSPPPYIHSTWEWGLKDVVLKEGRVHHVRMDSRSPIQQYLDTIPD